MSSPCSPPTSEISAPSFNSRCDGGRVALTDTQAWTAMAFALSYSASVRTPCACISASWGSGSLT